MTAPGREVLGAFGLAGDAEPFPGGRGLVWRCGDVALKPVDLPLEHAWTCQVYETWPAGAEVAVPSPLRTLEGAWSSAGWGAHRWIDGETADAGEDPEWFRRAAGGFHAATATLARPDFLDERDDPWAVGDRVAFGEQEPTVVPDFVEQALDGCAAVAEPSQVVHGDLAGNVLRTAAGQAVVIDWPPYFRPVGWALAVVAADAVCWQGADLSLLRRWDDVPSWPQWVRRALVYRVTTRALFEDDPDLSRELRMLQEVS